MDPRKISEVGHGNTVNQLWTSDCGPQVLREILQGMHSFQPSASSVPKMHPIVKLWKLYDNGRRPEDRPKPCWHQIYSGYIKETPSLVLATEIRATALRGACQRRSERVQKSISCLLTAPHY